MPAGFGRPTSTRTGSYCSRAGQSCLRSTFGWRVSIAYQHWSRGIGAIDCLTCSPPEPTRDVVLDRMVIINGGVLPEQWPAFYRRAIENLQPGVAEILIHPGFDNEELQQFFKSLPAWGAAWRQRDFDYFTGSSFRELLSQHDIKLITWRDIAGRLNQQSTLTKLRQRFRSR